MFADLPKPLQEKVREYLLENNFPAAKALYDEYHAQHAQQQHLSTHQNTTKHTKHTKHPQQVAR